MSEEQKVPNPVLVEEEEKEEDQIGENQQLQRRDSYNSSINDSCNLRESDVLEYSGTNKKQDVPNLDVPETVRKSHVNMLENNLSARPSSEQIRISQDIIQNSIRKNSNEQILLDQEEDQKGTTELRQKNTSSIRGRTTCMICQDEIAVVQLDESLPCWKEHPLCQDCKLAYIQNKVNEGDVNEICCPSKSTAMAGCSQIFSEDQVVQILTKASDIENLSLTKRNSFTSQSTKRQMHLTNLDYVNKYKKFLFNQKVDTNSNMRWCPVCTKKRSQSEVDGQEGPIVCNNPCVYKDELEELENQVIYLDGYHKYHEVDALNTSFSATFKKKANSLFTRVNPYHGKCENCNYEICMRCGLPYHKGKNCKAELDEAMRQYFETIENKKNLTNCPQCGVIVEKEEGGCNHMKCASCNYEFCWICGAHYKVDHFDRSNVFGCQGLQQVDPKSRNALICATMLHFITIPFTLLFYPVYVLFCAFLNPFYMPKQYRCLCFCKHLSMIVDNCCFSCCLMLFFAPIVFCLGIFIGALNLAIFIVPAYLQKLYKLFKMIFIWRCACCLNRH